MGNADDMYRWPWLEARIRRQPWIGLVILVCLILICVWILVSASHDRSPRSGLPLWLIALVGIVLFGFVSVKYIRVIVRRRKGGQA